VVVRQAVFRLSQEPHLRSLVTHNRVARDMALRFVAGETLADAIAAVQAINTSGRTATLDHLGENVTSAAEAAEATAACCAALRTMRAAGIDCNISVKLTQFGLDVDDSLARRNLHDLLAGAAEVNTFVRVDMEGSAYTDRTLDTVFDMHREFPNMGTVVQSMLYRTLGDVERLIAAGIRVRLVKGAYLEPPSLAFPEKRHVDANFVRLMRMLLESRNYPAIATHDPAMIDATRRYAEELGLPRDAFEFQMLFGVRRDVQEHLARDGYRVRVYVPYGTQWYPYFMRRLAERPANVMFVVNSLLRESRSAATSPG
jgi:proline dehydrogenase